MASAGPFLSGTNNRIQIRLTDVVSNAMTATYTVKIGQPPDISIESIAAGPYAYAVGSRVYYNGAPSGAAILVSHENGQPPASGLAERPALAYNPDQGHYLVAWADTRHDPGGVLGDILVQRVSVTGTLIGANTAVLSRTLDEFHAAVTYNPVAGEYLVAALGGAYDSVLAQRVSDAGVAAGGVITVTTPTPQSGAFGRPAVAAESDGETVVVWTDQDRAGLQRLMASGAFIGGVIVVDDDVNAEDASVAYGADDNSHLVAWIGVGSAYARVFRPVDADFSASPLQGNAPLTVTFTNLSKPAASITSYLWNFGDGVTSTITNPVHTYTQTGYFTVTLKAAAGAEEETITRTSFITVTGGGGAPSLITTTIVYTYDPLYRLIGANYSGAYTYTFAYRYDAVGNRTVQTKTITSTLVTTYTYDAANRLATQNGQSIFTWDNNGNLKADGSATYGYDFENRLISTTLGGVNTQFAYNGDGIRLRLIEAGTLTTYTQDYAAPLPVVLQAKTGSAATQYVYSMGTRPLAEYEAAAWEYLLPDPLGSVRQIANAGGSVTLLKSYEPYGGVLNSQGTATSIFGYSGEQVDATGLVFLRTRYMQPRLGVFLSHDPWEGNVLRPSSMNGWGFVEGNPINRVDPSGKMTVGAAMSQLGLPDPDEGTSLFDILMDFLPLEIIAEDVVSACNDDSPRTGDTALTYSEGRANTGYYNLAGVWDGVETVYDLISMQRAEFTVRGLIQQPFSAGATTMAYMAYAVGIDTTERLAGDYGGVFYNTCAGSGTNFQRLVGVNFFGLTECIFNTAPGAVPAWTGISGAVWVGVDAGVPLVVAPGLAELHYTSIGSYSYPSREAMNFDMAIGGASPFSLGNPATYLLIPVLATTRYIAIWISEWWGANYE